MARASLRASTLQLATNINAFYCFRAEFSRLKTHLSQRQLSGLGLASMLVLRDP